ncbi:MAG: hypothetical protein ACRDQW_01175 [Haloechinothrix sp.]
MMNEHTEQTEASAGRVPARIDLEDFIEAVTRGVARAMAAQEEVSGYLYKFDDKLVGTGADGTSGTVSLPRGSTMGLIFNVNPPRF